MKLKYDFGFEYNPLPPDILYTSNTPKNSSKLSQHIISPNKNKRLYSNCEKKI